MSVAYPFTPIGPDAVGGSEQVLTTLEKALTDAGHNSIVIAVKGSKVTGKLAATPEWNGLLNDSVRGLGQQQHRRTIERVLNETPIDLVHMHSLDFHRYLPVRNVPVLATLHLPPSWYPQEIFHLTRPNTYLNCVSSAQRRFCRPSPLLLPSIPNGVDVQRLDARTSKSKYVLALGRICPEKGFHVALDAARKARVEMVLAGEVFPYEAHQRYFEQEIVPRLDHRRQFIGPAGFSRKRGLLNEALCLLVPSTVPETSCLVAMEALACGTPVIAFPSGALVEIVEHGRTGFLVETAAEMAEAIKSIGDLSSEACRSAAKDRFCSHKMVERYFQAYNRIVNSAACGSQREEYASVRLGAAAL